MAAIDPSGAFHHRDRPKDSLRSLGPSDTAGVDGLEKVVVTPDGQSYSHTYFRNLGTLFVVTGLR